jgi:hypothetical protein
MRAVHRLMAARRPARAALDEGRVIASADHQLTRSRLLLIVALQTQRLVARLEHLVVHRAVRVVAGDAAFTQRLVLEDKRTALRVMTFQARLIGAREFGSTTDNRIPFMRLMAVTARHLPERVGMRQGKFAALVQVTLETRLGMLGGIDDRPRLAARLRVNAAGTVTRFAADVLHVLAGRHQLRVSRIVKPAGDRLMALGAIAGADKFRPRDLRRHDDRAVHHHAGNEQQAPDGQSAKQERIFDPTQTFDHGEKGLEKVGVKTGIPEGCAPALCGSA